MSFPCLKTGASHYVPPIRCYLWSARGRTTISCGMFMVVLTTASLHVSVLLSAFQHWSLALRDLRSYQTQTPHSEAPPACPSIHDPSLLILHSTLDSLHMQLDVDRIHFKYCQSVLGLFLTGGRKKCVFKNNPTLVEKAKTKLSAHHDTAVEDCEHSCDDQRR